MKATTDEKRLTYDIKSHAGNGHNDEIATRKDFPGEYDPEKDGHPVVHMVTGIDESGDSVYYDQSDLYAPAKTWEEARELVGADVTADDSPVHGKLHPGGMDRVDYWVVETTEEA